MDRMLQMIIRIFVLQLMRHGISGVMNYLSRRDPDRKEENSLDAHAQERLPENDPILNRKELQKRTRMMRRRF